MQKSKDILKDLIKDTESDKIRWDVEIDNDFIKASYIHPVTKNKKIKYKLVYFIDYPKNNRLHVTYETSLSKVIKSIMEIGGKSRKQEVDDISFLLSVILLKEEKHPNINIEFNFKIGDRIEIIKQEGLDGREIGQKGTIVGSMDSIHLNGKDDNYYIVQFDNRFNELLLSADTIRSYFSSIRNFKATQRIIGKCWAFEPKNIKKI